MQRQDLLAAVERVFDLSRDTFIDAEWLDDTETILVRLINDAPDAALLLDEEEG
jgi:hypothetical protein